MIERRLGVPHAPTLDLGASRADVAALPVDDAMLTVDATVFGS